MRWHRRRQPCSPAASHRAATSAWARRRGGRAHERARPDEPGLRLRGDERCSRPSPPSASRQYRTRVRPGQAIGPPTSKDLVVGGSGRIPALDGLRGAAVAAVLLFHGGHLDGGFLGVDLFFVLSGFLITRLLLEQAATGRVDLREFWARRARRLLPALAVVLVAVAGYALVFAGVDELHRIRVDGLATAFYFANWRAVVAPQTYWELFTKPSPLEHTWSLAIEEQFYL